VKVDAGERNSCGSAGPHSFNSRGRIIAFQQGLKTLRSGRCEIENPMAIFDEAYSNRIIILTIEPTQYHLALSKRDGEP